MKTTQAKAAPKAAPKAKAAAPKKPRQRKPKKAETVLGKAVYSELPRGKHEAATALAFTGQRYTGRAEHNIRMAELFEANMRRAGMQPYVENSGLYFKNGELERWCQVNAHKSWVSYMVKSGIMKPLKAIPENWQPAPFNETTAQAARIAEAQAILAKAEAEAKAKAEAAKPKPKPKRKAKAKAAAK